MTRRTGQITAFHAITGAVTVAVLAGAVAVALDLLVLRDEVPPLSAPAQEEADETCPPPRDGNDTPVTVAAGDLIECPDTYNGAFVRYQGEAVRAVLHRGPRAWLHLNDDPYALEIGPLYEHRTAVGGNSGIPVSVPAEVADAVAHVGDARHRGDTLMVTGVFHRADPADGGGPTIQGHTVHIISRGRTANRPLHLARAVVAATLTIAAGAAALLTHQRVR